MSVQRFQQNFLPAQKLKAVSMDYVPQLTKSSIDLLNGQKLI